VLLANLLEVAMIRGFGDSGSRGGEGSGGDEDKGDRGGHDGDGNGGGRDVRGNGGDEGGGGACGGDDGGGEGGGGGDGSMCTFGQAQWRSAGLLEHVRCSVQDKLPQQ